MSAFNEKQYVHILFYDAPFSVGSVETDDPSNPEIPLVTFSGYRLAPTPLYGGTQLISVVSPNVLTRLGLVAPTHKGINILSQMTKIPVPALTNWGTPMLSEFGNPILADRTCPGEPLTFMDGNPVLTPYGTPVLATPPIAWTPSVKEDSILALLGEAEAILDTVTQEFGPSDENQTGKRAKQRQEERRRAKQKSFQEKRAAHYSCITERYDCFVEAEYKYKYYVQINGETDESYKLKCEYEKSLALLNSAIKNYNDSVSNASANYVLSLVDNIIEQMLISKKRAEYFNQPEKSFTRNRLITLDDLLYYLLTLDRKSGDKEIFDFFCDHEDYIPTASAINQQRHKLKPEGVRYLFDALTRELFRVQHPTCKNRSIFGFDGTDSDTWYDETAENFVEGPKDKEGNTKKKGFNQNHIVTLGDVLSGIYLDFIIQPRPKMNETKAALEMVKRYKSSRLAVTLADRGFASFNLVETCRLQGMDACFRIREDFCKESKNMPLEERDEIFTTTIFTSQTNENKEKIKAGKGRYLSGDSPNGKYKKSKTWDYGNNYTMSFRLVRFSVGKREDGSTIWETIMTTLPKEEFSLEEIKVLYWLRWGGVEVPYRYLKYAANLTFYHSKLPEFTEQEINARFTIYNICRTILNLAIYGQNATHFELDLSKCSASEESASNAIPTSEDANKQNESAKENKCKSKKNKHEYQPNNTLAFYYIFDFVRNRGDVPFDLCNLIKRHLLPIRKGRSFERNISPQSFRDFWYR